MNLTGQLILRRTAGSCSAVTTPPFKLYAIDFKQITITMLDIVITV